MDNNGDKVRLEHLEEENRIQNKDAKALAARVDELRVNQRIILEKLDLIEKRNSTIREQMGKWVERVILISIAAGGWAKDFFIAR